MIRYMGELLVEGERTTCLKCDEELWGAAERFGLCILCAREEERDAEPDYVVNDDAEDS